MMDSGIDWRVKPEPWCWIGPQFQAQCEQIARGETPTFANSMVQHAEREAEIPRGRPAGQWQDGCWQEG